jgi:hypothetical protein
MRTAALILVVPPLAGFLAVGGFLLAETSGARPLSAEPANVSEAAAIGAAARTIEYIVNGENPNRPWRIREGVLGTASYNVNAIDAAILGRRPEIIEVLQQHGAVVVDPSRSACLIRAVDLPELMSLVGGVRDRAPGEESDSSDRIRACLESSGTGQ